MIGTVECACGDPAVRDLAVLLVLGWPLPLASVALWDRDEFSRRVTENRPPQARRTAAGRVRHPPRVTTRRPPDEAPRSATRR